MSLEALFSPRGIAVVGASPTPGNLAGRALGYLERFGFAGDLVGVNPKYESIGNIRCVPTLDAAPDSTDLALVMVPAARVPGVLDECADNGIGAAIVFSSGFAETGDDGRIAQDALARARDRGVRVLGPNCQGMIHRDHNVVATFTASVDPGLLDSSGIAYVGQSGAVGGSILDLAREAGIGLTAWASTGNQADLDVAEVADYLLGLDTVKVLMLYIEQMPDGTDWQRLLRRAHVAGKHVVVLAAGRSEVGRRAATSHTGAMVSPGEAFRLATRDGGAVVVDDIDELLLAATTLRAIGRVPGRRAAVITTSGGAGSLAADHLSEHGFCLPSTTSDTARQLAAVVPDFGAIENPIDVTAQLFKDGPEAFGDVCRLVRNDPSIDVAVVLLTMIGGDPAVELAKVVASAANEPGAPIVVVWLAGEEQTGPARAVLRDSGVPVYDSVGAAATILSVGHDRAVKADPVGDDKRYPDLATMVTGRHLSEAEAPHLLSSLGIASPVGILVAADDSFESNSELGDDLVLKIQSPDIAHKSDVGGVRVGVRSKDVRAAMAEMLETVNENCPDAVVDGVLVQQRARAGIELLVGIRGADAGYPPVLTVGLGGVHAEVHADVVSALAPVSESTALEMLKSLRSWPLFDGYRGAPKADVPAAAAAVSALSVAAAQWGDDLNEIEMNPILVHPAGEGITAVDLLLTRRTLDP